MTRIQINGRSYKYGNVDSNNYPRTLLAFTVYEGWFPCPNTNIKSAIQKVLSK
jgi:hypothetical protein